MTDTKPIPARVWIHRSRDCRPNFGALMLYEEPSDLFPNAVEFCQVSELEVAQRRVAELELALEYTGRERDANHLQYWRAQLDIEAMGYRIRDLESQLAKKEADGG